MKISVGSKVFLLGEYLALNGGPAITACFEPRFEMYFSKSKKEYCEIKNLFHQQSPAGVYYEKNRNFFHNIEIHFKDPHLGKGGWGASSAQFALLAAFVEGKKINLFSENLQVLDLNLYNHLRTNLYSTIDNEFLKVTKELSPTGSTPSGFDVLSQIYGGVCVLDRNQNIYKNINLDFGSADDYLVFHTGVKVATHSHLADLKSLNYNNFYNIVNHFIEALKNRNYNLMIKSINDFRNALVTQNLELNSTTDLINYLSKDRDILNAIKGCGALGADLIFLIYNKKNKENILELLRKAGITNFIFSSQLTDGLQFEITAHD